MRAEFDTAALEATMRALHARLDQHRDELNRLNVYPIPDADTGDNMLALLASVIAEMSGTADPIGAVVTGALLGGRGSSGVILGQALRGFATSLADASDALGLSTALTAAARAARGAVADPVEGTMLTVADDAAGEAGRVTAGGSVAGVARAAAREGRRSLARTPQLLPPLAEAGVVDAGGAGYVLFLDSIAETVTGVPGDQLLLPTGRVVACTRNGGGRYEVLCMVAADDRQLATLRKRWRALGDTVAIGGGEHAWRCHVHTDDVEAALAAARTAGPVSAIQITDLDRQLDGE